MEKLYVTYEETFEGAYTLAEMEELFTEHVDKAEWKYFENWLFDMLRSGIFVEA